MESFQPTYRQDRLSVVDTLRGLALFAILMANIPFAENADAVYKARNFVIGTPGTDKLLVGIFHMLIDKKFVAIFSILFGFGFYVQLTRAAEKDFAFRKYFFIRMLLLLSIACVHAYLLWFGDIIRNYAICGILLLLVYKWPSKRILITGIIFAIFITALVFILNAALDLQQYHFDRSILAEHPVTTSYWRYLQINARIDPFRNFIQDSPITLVFAFGCMLVGYWMAKAGFFHEPEKFAKPVNKFILPGLLFGLTGSYLFWMITKGELELTPALIWLPVVIVACLFLQSLFYIAAFIKLFHYTWFIKLTSPFEFVGKMALTNYILQSVLYLVVFFHCTNAFKLYGKLTLTETYLLAVIFFIIQIFFSRWWLKRNAQGPVEYLWKQLAYRFTRK